MSVTPVFVPEWKPTVSRPDGLAPIIMSGWVTPSKDVSVNEDIENPEKKRIKCDVYMDKNAEAATSILTKYTF